MHRHVYAASLLILCWYLMMAIHESGHVLATLVLGGHVDHLVLHPLAISQTVRSGSASALVDTWAGPVVGVLGPIGIWSVARRLDATWTSECRLWAGFCLLANGVYLGAGWMDGIGDAGDLLANGASVWSLLLFGAVCLMAGLWFIDGVHRQMGFGAAARPITPRRMWIVLTLMVAATVIGLVADLR